MNPDKPGYVLDSYALLALLNGEAGTARIQEILSQAQAGVFPVFLCTINLGEVLYIVERRRGLSNAQRSLALIENLPIQLVDAARNLVLDAAHIKAQYTISYADAFVVAVAQREGAAILTGDPEFKSVAPVCQVEWLP